LGGVLKIVLRYHFYTTVFLCLFLQRNNRDLKMKNKLYDGLLGYKLILSGLFFVLALHSGFANAEQATNVAKAKKQEPLTVTLTANKVMKDVNGKEIFAKADKVKPGDTVEYRASYANVSKAGLSAVVATLPIPKGMEYIDRTANPAAATATVDGAKYEPVPLKRMGKDKAGKQVATLVPVSEYRALRWSLGNMQSGKVLIVSARVHVAK
jgi:uncharacterized repeat protein (TIGR01451 family)